VVQAKLIEKIQGINSFAEIIETQQSKVDLKKILNIHAFSLDRVLQVEEDFLDTGHNHEHDDSVSSVGIEKEGELDLDKLNVWLSKLLQERGVDIFRSKGVLNVKGSNARYIFQGVHMLMSLASSEDGVGRGWKEGEKRTNRLVFIGRKLNREELEKSFSSCLA